MSEAPAASSTTNSIWQFNDGGRAAAGYKGSAGDCVTRAISIATGIPYNEVYDKLSEATKGSKLKKHRKASARDGVRKVIFHRYLLELGWTWVPTMFIGQGCKVHLKASELPGGKLIVSCSKHVVAVIDGVVNDTYDPTRDGTRCVYGYFYRTASVATLPIGDAPLSQAA